MFINYRYYTYLTLTFMNIELSATFISWSTLSKLFQLSQQSSLEIKKYEEDKHFDQVKALFKQAPYETTLLHYKPFIDVPGFVELLKNTTNIPVEERNEEIHNISEAEKIRQKIVCTTKKNPDTVIGFAVYFRKMMPCGIYDPVTKQIHRRDQPIMCLDGIIVDRQEQRKGVAKIMLQHIENQARKANLSSIVTDIYPKNYPALKAFSKMNYKYVPNSMDVETLQFIKNIDIN